MWLDLKPGEPENVLLANMKPKTRYNIRLAMRRGVTVRPACGPADLEAFHHLMIMTGKRNRFPVDSLAFYRAALAQFTKPDFSAGQVASVGESGPAATLLLAYHPDQPGSLAGLIAFAFAAEAIYMYG